MQPEPTSKLNQNLMGSEASSFGRGASHACLAGVRGRGTRDSREIARNRTIAAKRTAVQDSNGQSD